MKRILYTGIFALSALASCPAVVAEDTNLSEQQENLTLEERFTDLCTKIFIIVRTQVPQIDHAIKNAEKQKQSVEMILMARGMDKQKINQLCQTIIEKLMDGQDTNEIAKELALQPQYMPAKDAIQKLVLVMTQMVNIMITAASTQETLKELNTQIKSVQDELIASGKTEEEIIEMAQAIMAQIEDQIISCLAEASEEINKTQTATI